MKRLFIALVILSALGGAYYAWQQNRTPELAGSSTTVQTPTAIAETRDVKFAITVAGEIGPAEQVSVRPEVNGRVSELAVDIGDHVKAGMLLFSLDDKELQIELNTRKQEIDSAQLQLEKARISMAKAERDYLRDLSLHGEKLVSEQVIETSKQVWDSAKKDYELAANSVERSRTGLAQTEEKLTKTRVTAPFDCTVLTRAISAVGQAVSGSGGFNSGTEVMTIANLADLVILAHVNQVDVTRLRAGMEVRVAVEAVAGLSVTGVVERISPQATIVNNIKGFSARIRLKSPDGRVQPGMTANITIPVASAANVVAVPLAAVFTEFNEDSQQNDRFVHVASGTKFTRRPVRVGVADYLYAEIQQGLKAGEVVSLEMPPSDDILDTPAPRQESGSNGQAAAPPRHN